MLDRASVPEAAFKSFCPQPSGNRCVSKRGRRGQRAASRASLVAYEIKTEQFQARDSLEAELFVQRQCRQVVGLSLQSNSSRS